MKQFKFIYGQLVRIKSGFFKGLTGGVVDTKKSFLCERNYKIMTTSHIYYSCLESELETIDLLLQDKINTSVCMVCHRIGTNEEISKHTCPGYSGRINK